MCDFRNIVGVIIGGKVVYRGTPDKHISDFNHPNIDGPGLYWVGMSGVGVYYYDGRAWYTDYQDAANKCDFMVKGYECDHITNPWDIYTELKKQNYGF